MAAFREDTIVYPKMIELAACLASELEAAGLPQLCFIGVLPGQQVALDSCSGCGEAGKCGQAWVRLITAYPSSTFPGPAESPKLSTLLAYSLEVAVMRCAPGMDTEGNAPSVEQQLASVRLQMADMIAMRRAIACCLADTDLDYILGSYSPYGPQGGCVGGSWTVTLHQEN